MVFLTNRAGAAARDAIDIAGPPDTLGVVAFFGVACPAMSYPLVHASPSGSRFRRALEDLLGSITHPHLWLALGWLEIKQRYRRSKIGPFWITLSLGIMVAASGLIYSRLLNTDLRDYVPSLAVGLIVWQMISGLINEECSAFLAAEGIIKQIPTPLTVHILRVIWKNLIVFAHNMIIYILVMLIYLRIPGMAFFLAPLGLALIALNGVACGMILGVLSARFRDVPQIIINAVQLAFFITPVLWKPENLKTKILVVELNPLYYLIELVRKPLLGETPPLSLWAIAIGFTVINLIVGFSLFTRFRGRISYWL
jgi:ABC-2 type transport system permease protein